MHKDFEDLLEKATKGFEIAKNEVLERYKNFLIEVYAPKSSSGSQLK